MDVKEKTNIKEAYAGYYLDRNELLESSSGGVASILAEMMIQAGAVVYGAAYQSDFYSATYQRIDSIEGIQKLKGSKYIEVRKILNDGMQKRSVYDAVLEDLSNQVDVLFIGLGCDVSAIYHLCKKRKVDVRGLYIVELLCDGVTREIVHRQYVTNIEKIHNSKVVEFSVRNKRDGWIPLYIYAKFNNEEEHKVPFYSTDYGYAFLNYKNKGCYQCKIKNKEHCGDLVIGDYWGCEEGMKEFNADGVSIIYVQSDKGRELVEHIDKTKFALYKADLEYALRHSPRYFNSHERNEKWGMFDLLVKTKGLHEAVQWASNVCVSDRMEEYSHIILWGTGNCYHQCAPYVMERIDVSAVVDSDYSKWGAEMEYGKKCESPSILKNMENPLVIIMIYSTFAVCQVIEKLRDMKVMNFEYIENWMKKYSI